MKGFGLPGKSPLPAAPALTPRPAAEPHDLGAPIIAFVDQVLADAVRTGASDVHVEVLHDCLRVQYTIDGLRREITTAPLHLGDRVVRRLKVISGVDLVPRAGAPDGRLHLTDNGVVTEARVRFTPGTHGGTADVTFLQTGAPVPV